MLQAVFSKVDFAVDLEVLRNVTLNIDETKIAQVVRNVIRYLAYGCVCWLCYVLRDTQHKQSLSFAPAVTTASSLQQCLEVHAVGGTHPGGGARPPAH